jgi:hypothetical protein
MKIRLLVALAALGFGYIVPKLAQEKEPTPSESTPEVTPTPTLADRITRVLADRRVAFRRLAPKANNVKVLVGVSSGIYESQGTTTAEMTKDANGFWTVTLGPFDPNLYENTWRLGGPV